MTARNQTLELQSVTDVNRPQPEKAETLVTKRGRTLMLVASIAKDSADLGLLMDALGLTIVDWALYKQARNHGTLDAIICRR